MERVPRPVTGVVGGAVAGVFVAAVVAVALLGAAAGPEASGLQFGWLTLVDVDRSAGAGASTTELVVALPGLVLLAGVIAAGALVGYRRGRRRLPRER